MLTFVEEFILAERSSRRCDPAARDGETREQRSDHCDAIGVTLSREFNFAGNNVSPRARARAREINIEISCGLLSRCQGI